MADNRATLKAFFETGDIPTQAQFEALIDGLMSVVDADDITGEKTFQANIIIDPGIIIKQSSGGGELNLRVLNTDDFVSLTPDNSQFKQGAFLAGPDVGKLSFGDEASVPFSVVECTNLSVRFRIGGNSSAPNSQTIGVEVINNSSGTQIQIGFFQKAPAPQPVAIPDTSGATLAQLEAEVNKLKAASRALGLIAT